MLTKTDRENEPPDIAHRIVKLQPERAETAGYSPDRDVFAIRFESDIGSVSTDLAIEDGYAIRRIIEPDVDGYRIEAQFGKVLD